MQPEINQALTKYIQAWQNLLIDRQDAAFFASLKPVAVGWKVSDLETYTQTYTRLHDDCDQIVETWMNGRWIAKMHLIKPLQNGIEIVKLMQRRPASDDALGLDHVDFYSPAVTTAEHILKQETDLKWSWESNDVIAGYDWISIWFAGTEAKLKTNTVLDIVVQELQTLNQKIVAEG